MSALKRPQIEAEPTPLPWIPSASRGIVRIPRPASYATAFQQTIPILRIFAEEKSREFYVGFLGFTVDWEHRFEEGAPLNMQVSRGPLVVHLSKRHGDACPGGTVFVRLTGIAEFHRELTATSYKYNHPGLEQAPWNAALMEVHDPFGNRIRFSEDQVPAS